MAEPGSVRFWISPQGREGLDRAQRSGLPAVLRGIWTSGWLLMDQALAVGAEHLAEEAVRTCEMGRDFLGFYLPQGQALPEPRDAWHDLLLVREQEEERVYFWLDAPDGAAHPLSPEETGSF